ncbi:helix-turn-helix domain-containing protein [Gemmatimonas sp.]|uniref:helix-turn-helix transcriptional regulator n=1 Tax=Gemmatimonas sp. TaxID=1962908 RepID=UPI00333E87CA
MLGTAVRCHWASDLAAVPEHLADAPAGCCLVQVPMEADPALLAMLRHVRHAFPNAGLLAMFAVGRSSHAQLLQIGAVGVADVVVLNDDFTADLLRTRLERAAAESVASRLGRACAHLLSDEWVTLFKVALRLAQGPITLPDLATAAGLHERSLRKYCDRAGLPSPQWVIGWARALTAAHYLDEPGRTLVSVSHLLAFPSPSALQNLIRRYTGASPSTLRERGAENAVLQCLATALHRTPTVPNHRAINPASV